jgi:zinc D-Ala-D-Ala carboxypeptidase
VNISKHLKLEQMLATSHKEIENAIVRTIRYGRVYSVEQIAKNMELVADTLFDPFVDKFGDGTVDSGYRCPVLNTKVGGAVNSAHTVGLAIDWRPRGVTIREVMLYAIYDMLPFDRLIVEERGPVRWLHMQAPAWGADPVRALYESPKAGIYTVLTPGKVSALQA